MTDYAGRHSVQIANHRLESWVFADATERLAATGFTVDDVGRIAFQQNDTSYWRLSDDSPITWQTVTGGASTADLSSHVALDSTQTIHGHISFEMIQDMLATQLQTTGGIGITYDDAGNILTVDATVLVAAIAGLTTAVDALEAGAFDSPMTTLGDMIYGESATQLDYALASAGSLATASATNGPEVPANTIDNDLATAWGTGNNGAGEWLRIDLGVDRAIAAFQLVWNASPNQAQDYNIQSSADGVSGWTTRHSIVGNGGGASGIISLVGGPFTYRYWRMLCVTGGVAGNWLALKTMSLFSVGLLDGRPERLPVGTGSQYLGVTAGKPAWNELGEAVLDYLAAHLTAGDYLNLTYNDAGDDLRLDAVVTPPRALGWYIDGAVAVTAGYGPIYKLDAPTEFVSLECNVKTAGVGATKFRIYYSTDLVGWAAVGGIGIDQCIVPTTSKTGQQIYMAGIQFAAGFLRLDIDEVGATAPLDATVQLFTKLY